jgi:hypothetical protein
MIERRSGPGLSATASVEDCLRSPLLPGFELRLDDLFS